MVDRAPCPVDRLALPLECGPAKRQNPAWSCGNSSLVGHGTVLDRAKRVVWSCPNSLAEFNPQFLLMSSLSSCLEVVALARGKRDEAKLEIWGSSSRVEAKTSTNSSAQSLFISQPSPSSARPRCLEIGQVNR